MYVCCGESYCLSIDMYCIVHALCITVGLEIAICAGVSRKTKAEIKFKGA